jgi:hypothetical protein
VTYSLGKFPPCARAGVVRFDGGLRSGFAAGPRPLLSEPWHAAQYSLYIWRPDGTYAGGNWTLPSSGVDVAADGFDWGVPGARDADHKEKHEDQSDARDHLGLLVRRLNRRGVVNEKSYGSGLATHIGPESCGAARKGGVEALTGERAGRVFSRVRRSLRDADAVRRSGRPHLVRRYREVCQSPARSETPCTYADTSRGNREIPSLPKVAVALGRVGESKDVRR